MAGSLGTPPLVVVGWGSLLPPSLPRMSATRSRFHWPYLSLTTSTVGRSTVISSSVTARSRMICSRFAWRTRSTGTCRKSWSSSGRPTLTSVSSVCPSRLTLRPLACSRRPSFRSTIGRAMFRA